MRIVVINTAASSGGALSILKDFYQYVKENDNINEWIFLLSDYYIESTDNITVKVISNSKKKINRLKLDNFNGYRLVNQYNPDIVFSMQNTTIANLTVPQVLYLHQPIPFQKIKKYSFFKKDEFKYAIIQHILGANIKYGLNRADKVIVQTNWMKNAIIEQTKIVDNDILVIPPSISIKELSENESRPFKGNSFFYPTSLLPYKNISLIEEACNYIDSIEPNLDYKVDITVEAKFKNDHINSIGMVSRDEVYNKLSNEVLIFPSYIETFGLPLAEGRYLNTIIFAANTPFSNEILEGYNNSFYFKPFNEKELGKLMLDSIKGRIVKYPPSIKSRINSNSWERVYKLLLSGNLLK